MDILTCNCAAGTGEGFDGIVNTYADLPVDDTADLGAVYLVRQSTGVWLISRKQAGLYQRLDTSGNRDTDWQYLGDWIEEFSDANFSVYNATDTSKSVGFDVSTLTAGARRTLTVLDEDGTIALLPGAKSPNQFYASPISGSSAEPDWRALDVADLPDEAIVDTGAYSDPSWLTDLSWSKITFTPNSLSGYGITDAQPLDADLTAIAMLTTTMFGRGLLEEASASSLKTNLSLNNVENTALSTWAGSSNLTTLGTVTSGTWSAAAIGPTKGGTGLTSYTLGDLPYASASNTLSALAGNTSATKKFLNQTGTGSASAAPAWSALLAADIPDISATYAKTGLATSSGLTMNSARILGRTTASAGALEELTVGSSLTLSASVLNAIQDIRTSAAPTFASLTINGDVSLGLGGTGTAVSVLEISGGSSSGGGGYLAFDRNGIPKNYIGASSALHANNTDDMDLVSTASINFYPAGSKTAAITSTGLNGCVIGATTAAAATFTTAQSAYLTADDGSGSLPSITPTSAGAGGSGVLSGPSQIRLISGGLARQFFVAYGGSVSINALVTAGSRSSPSASTNGLVTRYEMDAWDGSATQPYAVATYDLVVDGAQTTSNHGGYFKWSGVPNGSTTSAEWMRLQASTSVALTLAGTINAQSVTFDDGSGAYPSIAPTQSGSQLRMFGSTGLARMFFTVFTGDVSINSLVAGGTRASPAASPNGRVMRYELDGWDGVAGALYNSATFDLRIDGTHSSSNHGGYFNWNAVANGATSAADWMKLQSGNLTVNIGSITTGAPSSGTAAAWKLGSKVTTTGLTMSTTGYVQLDVAGTLYKLALCA